MLAKARGFLLRSWFLLPLIPLVLSGCSRETDNGLGPQNDAVTPAAEVTRNEGTTPPAGLATVDLDGESLEFWPYTGGQGFNGQPSDPMNLILAGQADPLAIRQALLQLDGDRTAFGFPDIYPFNATWSDARGDIQTTWSDGDGWVGNVLQLQLGTYDPGRVHLRLFRTGQPYGDQGGVWTLAAAHFEVLIPGTADHQVVSWVYARDVVAADLARAGLIDPANVQTSSPITQTPSFRTIPDYVYNELPDALIDLIGGPPKPVSEPVPIDNDGTARMLHLVHAVPVVPGTITQSFTLSYGIVMPKPFCSSGPYDFVRVDGPVEFTTTTTVYDDGSAEMHASYRGLLTVVPIDVTVDPPRLGQPYSGEVSEVQSGYMDATKSQASVQVKKIAPQSGGAELEMIRLHVGSTGNCSWRYASRCLAPGF